LSEARLPSARDARALERLWRPRGLLTAARQVPSPFSDDRPQGVRPWLLVVHGISLPPRRFGGRGVEELFTGRLDAGAHPYYEQLRGARVSAHFFIRRSGALLQFVGCDRRAWHAGASAWRGHERCNDFSIGVELEGADTVPYRPAQYRRLAWLTWALRARYPLVDVAGHSDIAPGRKTDPGPAFSWAAYRAALSP
jgi:AmpD protein